ncbi:hypothetical protein LXL04_039142 [Taraxacum kok-saghyz]
MNRLDSKKNHADLKNHPDSKINADPHPQGDGGGDNLPPLPPSAEQPERQQRSHNGNKACVLLVYKSGPLFLSSKGIGWTSWKKRWFILTETSLVFFRSDPNVPPQKAGDSNLTLGGIDLNSSGSVVVKADKKLLTVLFPDGRDGRAFTLKAETCEDLNEWKDALEAALSNAPSAGLEQGQNSVLPKNEKGETAEDQSKDQTTTKSIVLGRPILLALEDTDGTPSFLEKALCYVEDHGINVEGILRQAADVDDVERRIREYEQGKREFTADEDGHVIGDCIKKSDYIWFLTILFQYVLREMPSPPVPASCCAALLEAYRTDRGTRVGAIRAAICDTFPEPNRRLLQRILIMMEAVAENKVVNRMSVSAVAACMSPLLLRPLLAGEVDLGKGPDVGGDGSVQLLQAAAAANHAQAICITLIEEYDKIFGEEDMLSDLYSDSDEYGSESEEVSDEYYEEDDDVDVENRSERSCSYEDSESVSYSESGDDDHSKGSVSSNSVSIEASDDGEDEEFITRKHTRTTIKKGSPLESIDLVIEQQAEILRLEAMKIKLKERIEAEANRNAVLKEDLVRKKNSLEARRIAFAEGVSKLEEELHKEKDIQSSVSTDTNADPDVSGPKNQQPEQSLSPNHGQEIDKDKDRETITTSHKNKETRSSKEHVDKNPFHSFSSKHPERSISKCTSSRRPPPKAEAANTTSALSKITNRLNFLKEKRTQIADDLENVDKDSKTHKHHHRGSKKWSESPQISDESHTQSSDKGKETSFQQKEASVDKGRSEDQSTNSR